MKIRRAQNIAALERRRTGIFTAQDGRGFNWAGSCAAFCGRPFPALKRQKWDMTYRFTENHEDSWIPPQRSLVKPNSF
jgi:hypothetical protein